MEKVIVSKILNFKEGYCLVDVFSTLENAREYQNDFCDSRPNWMSSFSVTTQSVTIDSALNLIGF